PRSPPLPYTTPFRPGHLLLRVRQADGPDGGHPGRGRATAQPHPRAQHGSLSGEGVEVEVLREAHDRAQPAAPRPGGRVAILERVQRRPDARAPVDGEHLEPDPLGGHLTARDELPSLRVPLEVLRELRGEQRDLADLRVRSSERLHQGGERPSRTADPALLCNGFAVADEEGHHDPAQWVMVTSVPLPGSECRWNSWTRRFEPPSPSPRPFPVVNPSFRACCRSGIPGPSSLKVRLIPRRPLSSTTSIRASPPPPWTITLRPSSLAAVMILVWSTMLKRSSTLSARTRWRRRTRSPFPWRGSRSSSGVRGHLRRCATAVERCVLAVTQQGHAALDVECCENAGQLDAQLHQGD